ncbi:MAG: Zn-ribbon domain-containing OB-fold protein [Pseudomonadota bacterium]|nr:Zn-ribbon domain-containing OB-fold protein [Pseudomonadota bacterium]
MYEIDRVKGWPMPPLDDLNRTFFEAMADGKVMVQRCADCGTWLAPGAFVCDNCASENLTWDQASGTGEVYSYVVYHRAFDPAFESLVPYNVCLIEMDEGPRLLGNTVGIENDQIQIGMKVKAVFNPVGDGLPMLQFQPA